MKDTIITNKTDVLDYDGVVILAKNFPNTRASRWSQINKNDYLQAMQTSVINSSPIQTLLSSALTDKINDRETFMKGIDYSYYYEQED